MSVPKSVTKINKDGVQFVSSVDRVEYTMKELCRAALRDVGKFVCREFRTAYYSHFKKKRYNVGKNTQFWVKYKYEDYPSLQVGLKPAAFYGGFQELGTYGKQGLRLLSNSVENNIQKIIEIESQYLSALEEEAQALAMISDEDYEGGAE